MNICSTMNSRRKARYGYKPFLSRLSHLFTSLWSKKLLNSLWRTYLVEIWSPKAASNSLPRGPQFLSVFKTWLRKAYQQSGTETNPVIGLNYLLSVGHIWWRSEVTQLFYDFLNHGATWPYFYKGCQKWVCLKFRGGFFFGLQETGSPLSSMSQVAKRKEKRPFFFFFRLGVFNI